MFPQMAGALRGLTTQLPFQVIEHEIQDHEVVERTAGTRLIEIMITPLQPREIAAKAEGERAWKWLKGVSAAPLQLGWTLIDPRGLRYRVMAVEDWSQSGFYNYHLAQRATPEAIDG